MNFQLALAQFTRTEGFWSNPNDEMCTEFFKTLTDPASQRENWYSVTPYIAEFWCALSNIGFFIAGIKHKSPELMIAGTASLASHTVPKKWLHTIDLLGVAIAFGGIAFKYRKFIRENPRFLLLGGAAGAINAIDAYFARNKGKTVSHVIWHLSAAYLSHIFLKNAQEYKIS